MRVISNGSNSVHIMPTEEYFQLVRSMLDNTGQASVRVTGMSMWPLLYHLRDSVLLSRPDQIRTGDVVLFDRLNGRYALHRIVRKKKSGFDMAGDHQWHIEHDLPYEQIMGVVTGIYRNGRYISCKKLYMKLYARTVVLLTVPRICLRRAAVCLRRPVRSVKALKIINRKGANR